MKAAAIETAIENGQLRVTTLSLSAEFQAQRHTCKSFTVSLNNLSVLN
jgi:hypothetical protein